MLELDRLCPLASAEPLSTCVTYLVYESSVKVFFRGQRKPEGIKTMCFLDGARDRARDDDIGQDVRYRRAFKLNGTVSEGEELIRSPPWCR